MFKLILFNNLNYKFDLNENTVIFRVFSHERSLCGVVCVSGCNYHQCHRHTLQNCPIGDVL